ncbi:MAG: chloride channel protein [Acidobacteriota bacterium]|jgi:CIC family chloride channel protein|nr:chloride channel protein [Acidobacteriota bacterium]
MKAITVERLIFKFLMRGKRRMEERHFLLFASFLVGVASALAAIALKQVVHLIQELLTHDLDVGAANYPYLVYPVVGVLAAGVFVRYVVRDDISHGITRVLYAISQRKSRIKPHNMWSSLAASAVTIGFGGSVGAEAPIVYTGAAIGSNLGRLFRVAPKSLMLLIGCGAAGAIAGIFKAPIAGMVFVIEVLMLDLTLTSVMPLLVSSVTAATVSYLFTGMEAMFRFSQTEAFEIGRIPYVLALGVACGLLALYVTRTMLWLEGVLRTMGYWRRFVLCAAILSALIFLLPPLYGEGYDAIALLLGGHPGELMDKGLFYGMKDSYFGIVIFLSLVLLAKVFASTATNGGGGCGGVFAPSLYLGCILGFVFAHVSNYVEFTRYLPEKNFALLGMAGVLAGVMHAPLTGVFLIAELTGGYDLFFPLMLVAASSYSTIRVFESHNLYALRLAQKGELITHRKDKAVLTLLNLDSVLETDFEAVRPDMTLGDVVKIITRSGRNAFPVTDGDGVLLGVVKLDEIRNIMFRPELYDRFRVSRFMVAFPARIASSTPMDQVMRIFDDTGAWNLPVVDEAGRYLGFVSKSKIFGAYRKVLEDNFPGD